MGFDFTDSVGYELARAAKAHRNRAREELSELGLHIGQEILLFQLWEEDGLSQSELADRGKIPSEAPGRRMTIPWNVYPRFVNNASQM